jgi:Dolichyl-phosphate-mannose-protein mannosyltransferase
VGLTFGKDMLLPTSACELTAAGCYSGEGYCLATTQLLTFGKPQAIAAALLVCFTAQCVWLMAHTPPAGAELQLHTSQPLPNNLHSPLTSLLATVPARLLPIRPDASSILWWIILRAPFTLIGMLLGATVWYIARRLYGDYGGYIALALYCFSPAVVVHSATVTPEIVAAFGAFATVWTGIATAHTLYAPREVVLWNWKRILMLGVAIALGVGAQFSIAIVVLLTIAFMLYLVPQRKAAALAIMAAACAIALLVLLALFGFSPAALLTALHHARWLEWSPTFAAWKMVGLFVVGNSAGLALLIVVAFATFVAWRHTRYFGTWAPLIASVVLALVVLLMPRAAGFGFLIVMLPFAIVFAAGVWADLLEVHTVVAQSLATGVIIAVLVAHALFSMLGLRQLGNGENSPHQQAPHAELWR